MNKHEPYPDEPFPKDLPPDDGYRSSLYDKDPELARIVDRLATADESEWEQIAHEFGLSGKDLLNGAELADDVPERFTTRNLILRYRQRICEAVERAIQAGKIPAAEKEAKLDELFARPYIVGEIIV